MIFSNFCRLAVGRWAADFSTNLLYPTLFAAFDRNVYKTLVFFLKDVCYNSLVDYM